MKRRSGFSAPGTLRPGYLSKTFPVGAWAHHDTQARTGGRRGTPPHPTGGSTPHNPRLAIRGLSDKNLFHGRGRRNTHTAPGRGMSTRRADSRTQLGSGLPTTPLARAGARIPKPRRPPGARRAHHGAEGAGGRRQGALPRDGETHAPRGPGPKAQGDVKDLSFRRRRRGNSLCRCGKSRCRHSNSACGHGKSRCRHGKSAAGTAALSRNAGPPPFSGRPRRKLLPAGAAQSSPQGGRNTPPPRSAPPSSDTEQRPQDASQISRDGVWAGATYRPS